MFGGSTPREEEAKGGMLYPAVLEEWEIWWGQPPGIEAIALGHMQGCCRCLDCVTDNATHLAVTDQVSQWLQWTAEWVGRGPPWREWVGQEVGEELWSLTDQEHPDRGECVSLSREKGEDVNSQCRMNTQTPLKGHWACAMNQVSCDWLATLITQPWCGGNQPWGGRGEG